MEKQRTVSVAQHREAINVRTLVLSILVKYLYSIFVQSSISVVF